MKIDIKQVIDECIEVTNIENKSAYALHTSDINHETDNGVYILTLEIKVVSKGRYKNGKLTIFDDNRQTNQQELAAKLIDEQCQ